MENMFTLEGLNEVLEFAKKLKDESKAREENEKMNNFTRIVKGVARKYASKWVEREDLEQDLWVKVLSMIEDCGGIENVTEKMVAKCCFNLAVDKYRYHRRRYESKSEYIEGSNVDDRDTSPDYFDRPCSIESALDILLYKEVIDLFDRGSRERKYVILKLVNSGLLDVMYLNEEDREDASVIPDGDTEADYIRLLGYAAKCPGSWTCKKRMIDKVIHEFLR